MPPELRKFIAQFEASIRKETNIKKIFNALMEMRQIIGHWRMSLLANPLEFKNDKGKVVMQVAAILLNDWHNLNLTLITAWDDAEMQVINHYADLDK